MILCFSVRCAKWVFSRFCRKNSAIRPEVGAPIASPFLDHDFLVVGKAVSFCDGVVPTD